MIALIVLGIFLLALVSGIAGWMTAARRYQAGEAALRLELESARTGAEQAQSRHEAIVGELTRTALRVIRSQGGESL